MQLWPLAMMIAQFIGGDAHRETLRQMLDAGLPHGSTLHTFSLLATSSHDRVASSVQGPAAPTPLLATSGNAGAPIATAPLQPGPPGFAAWSPTSEQWPRTLLIMAANRKPGDAAALSGLGDHLWTLDRPDARTYAHVCYILAGRPLDAVAASDSRFLAPGVDHLACMGGMGIAGSLQRAELLSWCMSQSQSLPMYLLAPSYLQVCPCPPASCFSMFWQRHLNRIVYM